MNPAEFETLVRAEEDLWWFRGMRKIIFRLLDDLPVNRHRKVLEAGCGTGHFAEQVSRRYGWQVYPTDLSWVGLSHGRKSGRRLFTQADISSLPYASGSFDLALSMDVLVHFERGAEERAIAEFARVLAPGGLLALRVSALDVLRSRHSAFAGERQRFTRARLRRAVENNGFRVLRVSYANSLLMPVALARFRVWEPLLRLPPRSGTAPVPRWLDWLLYMPLAVESACLGSGVNFPLGQSLILVGEKV
jgi:SAM-dependent methyltransferase